MTPHTAAKNDIDTAYATLVGTAGTATPGASFSKYTAATNGYEIKYHVCVSAPLNLVNARTRS